LYVSNKMSQKEEKKSKREKEETLMKKGTGNRRASHAV